MRKKLDRLWLVTLLFAVSMVANAATNITVINLYAEPQQKIAVAPRKSAPLYRQEPIYQPAPLVEEYSEDDPDMVVEEAPEEEMVEEEVAE